MTVLIVEDERHVGEMLELMLEEFGARPQLRTTFDAAYYAASLLPRIDLALLSPFVTGCSTIPITEVLGLRSAPLLMMAGDGEERPEFLRWPSLPKPFGLTALLAAFCAVLA